MNFTVSSHKEEDYLVVKGSGGVNNIDEYKLLIERYYDEFKRHNARKIIVDEREMGYPSFLELQIDIVNFIAKIFPTECRIRKLKSFTASNPPVVCPPMVTF